MTDITERYQRITDGFTERARAVPPDGWDSPSPCEGWTARDVVGHLVGWIPGFFGQYGIEFPELPPVSEAPAGAWEAVQTTIGNALADPATAAMTVDTPLGTHSLAETVD